MKKPVKSRLARLLGKGRRFKSGRPHQTNIPNQTVSNQQIDEHFI